MKWFRIRGPITVISTKRNNILIAQVVNVIYQSADRDLFKGSEGYIIRPTVPYDNSTLNRFNKPTSKFKWMLFYPIKNNHFPDSFPTLKEAKERAEAHYKGAT